MKATTPTEKATFTNLINKYIKAKRDEEAAKAAKVEAANQLIKVMAGEQSTLWTTDAGANYLVSVTYGKTRKSLSKNLIESVLGVKVTDECFTTSAPWDELRITIK